MTVETVADYLGQGPSGAEILEYVRKYLRYFCVWPNDATLDTCALWAAHAHARRSTGTLVWQATPRLLFQSAEPGSGKSHAMRLVSRICPSPETFTEPSEPAVAHAVGKERATLFLDECDVLFGAGGRKTAIRAVINDGYTPEGTWPRVRNGSIDKISTFGALAMAGLDKMEAGTHGAMTATLTRCIRVRMRKAPSGWSAPRFDKQARAITDRLSKMLAEWTARTLDELEDYIPELPEGVGNRDAELWEPLIAVADKAGGDWPHSARAACVRLTRNGSSPQDTLEAMVEVDDLMAGWDAVGNAVENMPADAAESDADAFTAMGMGQNTASVPTRILDALRASEVPMSTASLAAQVECSYEAARTAVSRMSAAGEVYSPQRGLWASDDQVAGLEARLADLRARADAQP